MSRYFVEVAYRGTLYSGFQTQQNANTIQAEVERALNIYFKDLFSLTGSSRTDAGVHALQNFFHFDYHFNTEPQWDKSVYALNAILPDDIVLKKIYLVAFEAHCRFDARRRSYEYTIYQEKNPFIADVAFYYPYKLNLDLLNEAAALIVLNEDFAAFSKRNTQVKTTTCVISKSQWTIEEDKIIYRVSGNRFLRGMVKGLVGTMLKVGRKKISVEEFKNIIDSHDPSLVDFSVPSHGLTLVKVAY